MCIRDRKERLVAGVPKQGTAIIGVDDEWCQRIASRLAQSGKRLVRVSMCHALADGFYLEHERIMCADGGSATPIAEIGGIGSLRGLHNAQNAACAAAAALALGLAPAAIQAGLRSFPGLADRMEEVGRHGAVLFVNDSKATNADSAAQALACFSDIFWIAGGNAVNNMISCLLYTSALCPMSRSRARRRRLALPGCRSCAAFPVLSAARCA